MPSHSTLREIGENAIVAALTQDLPQSPRTVVGPGDDCAVLRPNPGEGQVFKTDCIVEDVHFLADTPGELVGRKALCRALSDLAAMGAVPQEAVITLGAPADTLYRRVAAIYAGLRAAAVQYRVGLAGGETVAVPQGSKLFINVAMLGSLPSSQALLRSTAQPGDAILVTGVLGGTLAGHHLSFEPRLPHGQWLRETGYAAAAMDLSDGLAMDLPRLAAASNCGFALDLNALPCRPGCTPAQAAGDGEDYELLFTCRPERLESLLRRWPYHFPDVPLTKIGEMTAVGKGTKMTGGWEHF